MNVLEIMFAVWSLVFVAFVALMVYRGHLHIHETLELFLSDNSNQNNMEKADKVLRRASRIQPFCTGLGGAAAAICVLMVGIYVVQQIPYMRF